MVVEVSVSIHLTPSPYPSPRPRPYPLARTLPLDIFSFFRENLGVWWRGRGPGGRGRGGVECIKCNTMCHMCCVVLCYNVLQCVICLVLYSLHAHFTFAYITNAYTYHHSTHLPSGTRPFRTWILHYRARPSRLGVP